jgi:predicted RNA-binding Zn-ribbon protein involved in translation (DUF1610 family)
MPKQPRNDPSYSDEYAHDGSIDPRLTQYSYGEGDDSHSQGYDSYNQGHEYDEAIQQYSVSSQVQGESTSQ